MSETPDLTDALRAVHEALTLPMPTMDGDWPVFAETLEHRVQHVQICLRFVLSDLDGADAIGAAYTAQSIAHEVSCLRNRIDDTPATYRTSSTPAVTS